MSENWPLAIKGYFSQFYDCICLISTLLLVGYSIFVYAKNYDISRVNYKEFHSTMKDIYPSISLCFGDTLDPEILKTKGLNKTSYWKFLIGEESDKNLFDINFDDISVTLEDYLFAILMIK